MYTALYRAYRPSVFSEILGQEHIVKILKNQISSNSVSHAYLFCGTRGTGKTTTARLLAKGVNCLAEENRPCGVCENCISIRDGIFVDVIEIDAASHNGVDNIRELRESVKYPPAAGRKKVYIIDEVHMLSTGAFNALLKTLEEPPDNVLFILATTESQKLPATILSRCLRLDFHRVPEGLLIEKMGKICQDTGIHVAEDALRLIASNADGSVRDGLSILDQCLSGGEVEVSRDDVLALLGASGEEIFAELTQNVSKGRVDAALLLLSQALADGKDTRQFMKDWLGYYRNLLIAKFVREPQDILNLSGENIRRLQTCAEEMALSEINRGITEIARLSAEAKWSTQPRILLELCIVNLCVREEAANSDRKAPEKPVLAAQVNATHPKEKESKAGQPPPGQEKTPTVDLDKLWEGFFQGENCLMGSFNIIRGSSRIKSLSDAECIIEVRSETTKIFIEKNKEPIQVLLAQRAGFHGTLVCTIEGQGNSKPGAKSAQELAAELQNTLGIDIEIEE